MKLKQIIRAIWIFLYYMIPTIVLGYTVIQLLLFLGTYFIPLVSKLTVGYNHMFLYSLPIIFQPAKYKFGQMVLTIISGLLGWKLIEIGMSHGKLEWKEQLPLNIVAIGFITLICLYPETIQYYVGKITTIILGIFLFGYIVSHRNTHVDEDTEDILGADSTHEFAG